MRLAMGESFSSEPWLLELGESTMGDEPSARDIALSLASGMSGPQQRSGDADTSSSVACAAAALALKSGAWTLRNTQRRIEVILRDHANSTAERRTNSGISEARRHEQAVEASCIQ